MRYMCEKSERKHEPNERRNVSKRSHLHPIHTQTGGLEALEIAQLTRYHLPLARDVVAADLHELREDQRAPHGAGERHVARRVAVQAVLVAAGALDFPEVALVRVRVTEAPAGSRRVE